METNDTPTPNIFIHLACIVTLVPAIYISTFVYFVVYSYIFYK